MSFYDSDSPATSESQTQIPSPFIPSGSMSGYSLGMSSSTYQPSQQQMPGTGMQPQQGMPGAGMQPQQQMPGTMQQSQMGGMMQQPQMGGLMQPQQGMQQPQMGGMMPGYYNMSYGPGYYNMPGMQQMPGMQPTPPMMGQQQMPQMMPGMQPQPQMMGQQQMPQMQPQQQMLAGPGGSRRGGTTPAGDNVYRPYFDMLDSDSPVRTAQETRDALEQQFPDREMFSLADLDIAPPTRRSRDGKGKATSSRAAAEDAPGDAGGRRRRSVWTIEECVALAKAWISVVEDPYSSNNQHIDRMWFRISQNYRKLKPDDSVAHPPDTCRKQWDRLKKQLSRFAGLYQKNLQMTTSGMTSDDVKALAHQQFPDSEKGFGEFKYWEVYLVVETSPKFMAGVEAGWPKRTKLNSSGEYSSSAGSHELPEAEADIPTRPPSARRRRPLGQKSAMRRTSGSRSQDVQSEAPAQMPPDMSRYAEMQMTQLLIETTREWHAATDPTYKRCLKDGLDKLRRDMGLPPVDAADTPAGEENDDTDDGE